MILPTLALGNVALTTEKISLAFKQLVEDTTIREQAFCSITIRV